MKRQFHIVQYHKEDFTLDELEVVKGRIANLKETEIYRGSQFIFDKCVFQIMAIQNDFDADRKNIALAQVTTKQKSKIIKPSVHAINTVKDNGG